MTQPSDDQLEAARVRKRQLLTDATDDGLQIVEVPGLGHFIPDHDLDEEQRIFLATFIDELKKLKGRNAN